MTDETIAQMRAKMELIERMRQFETDEVRAAGQQWIDRMRAIFPEERLGAVQLHRQQHGGFW